MLPSTLLLDWVIVLEVDSVTNTGRLKAAWTLVLLAPLCAEATFTGISLPTIWLAFPLLIPIYGGGVLLARELVCRTGAGWLGLLVLGFAYELAEDGLGLQALTSPHLYTAAQWGPRVLGINTTYWESQIGYHLVFTVLIPVTLTTLIFKRHGQRPYLGRFGMIGTALVFVIGIALARVGIATSQDPGYQEPWSAVAAVVIGIVVLGILALVVLPRLRTPRPTSFARLPHPAVLATVAAIAPIVFLGLLFPSGTTPATPRSDTAAGWCSRCWSHSRSPSPWDGWWPGGRRRTRSPITTGSGSSAARWSDTRCSRWPMVSPVAASSCRWYSASS